ncbi:C6 finger domain [Mycena indigotica]|uniref:C6 finger domain n=1 Tax=Mycena indigotica TaxID=2126181 RepID=A0A8H6S404_9AGAR|nr:C6 finger domain [Mycena indigotica]KAF7292012.1 C6 finger domain [Mycena indigotica]
MDSEESEVFYLSCRSSVLHGPRASSREVSAMPRHCTTNILQKGAFDRLCYDLMPFSSLSTKSNSTNGTEDGAGGDHRKKRRNRTTQSCINCHATKRMCDRKRPCTRCTQLGLTGNCVYEVDDRERERNALAAAADNGGKTDASTLPALASDVSHLRSRIAELEGVIRELKNKPHPRWMTTSPQQIQTPDTPPKTPSSPTSLTLRPAYPLQSARFESTPPPDDVDPALDSLLKFFMYDGFDSPFADHNMRRCGCATEGACYSALIELSSRLRDAKEALALSPSHMGSSCRLHSCIDAIDRLINNSLLRGSPPSPQIMGRATPTNPYANFTTYGNQFQLVPGRTPMGGYDAYGTYEQDAFMSWNQDRIPQRFA